MSLYTASLGREKTLDAVMESECRDRVPMKKVLLPRDIGAGYMPLLSTTPV